MDKIWAIPYCTYCTEAVWGFFCIFSSVNAADNKQRDKSMSCIKVNIDVWVIFNIAWLMKVSGPFACKPKFISNLTAFLSITEVHDEMCMYCVFFILAKITPSAYGIMGRVFLWCSTRWRKSMCLLSSLDSSSPPVTTMMMRRKSPVIIIYSL